MSLWGLLCRRQRPSGFGPASTAEEVTAGVDAGHLTAIVTGATGGIGKETARVLTLRGAKVIIAARTLESGMAAKESLMLTDKIPSSKLHVMEMDLSSLDSVRSFAQSFVSSHEHLNILINNAGVYLTSFRLSKDGIELQFATNHLGHFLLTNLLLDKMKTTAKETGVQGRIINVSSVAHKFSNGSCFDLEKIGDESNRFYAYPRSKLANVLHSRELSRRFQMEGCNLTANSMHPGVISTNVGRNSTMLGFALSLLKHCLKNIPQWRCLRGTCRTTSSRSGGGGRRSTRGSSSSPLAGPHHHGATAEGEDQLEGAATVCYLALHPIVKDVSGKYFEDCNEATPSPLAEDVELAKKLWDLSEEMVKRRPNCST